MSNIVMHPISAGHPGRIRRIEINTGLIARPAGNVVLLEPRTARQQARELLKNGAECPDPKWREIMHRRAEAYRGDDDPTPPSAA